MSDRKTKEKHVSVRLTGADLAVLERAAAASKLSVATYVRQKALQAAEREDPAARRRRVADALAALREGITAGQASRLREAARRSE